MHIRVDTEDRWAADVIGQRAAETLSDCYHHRFIEGKVITKPSCWAGDGKEEENNRNWDHVITCMFTCRPSP